jgi:hypothetical protein
MNRTLSTPKRSGHARIPLLSLALALAGPVAGAVRDTPFLQAASVKYTASSELQGAALQRLVVNNDGIVYVLTDRGLARLFEDRLSLDRTFRPLAGKTPRDITALRGRLFYLFEDEYLSNEWGGRYQGRVPAGGYRRLAVADDFSVLLASATNLALLRGTQIVPLPFAAPRKSEQLQAAGNQFFVLAGDLVFRVANNRVDVFHRGKDLTALAVRGNQMWLGTSRGYYGVDSTTGREILPLQTNLPAVEVTCLAPAPEGLWVGTTRGVVYQAGPGRTRYFASKRWLDDDQVTDIQLTRQGDAMVLTRTGLNKIEFRRMTLAEKAAYYDRKVRQRHMRYGFCAELRLRTPGDITTAEMIDTDNDGTWSSYYLASQAFRFAVTGEEEARANAWETFGALERLQAINPLDGFPARTFERTGFKVSDPDRWHTAPDTRWEWKAHTSSDEITAHTFAYAVLLETTARTPAEKARIAGVYDRILAHIVRNKFYLVDVDGQPTLWGRWNPEYVNHYPPTIGDRRLNSAEMIAFLQFGFQLTGKPVYRERAFELLDRHDYRKNITNTMAALTFTPGYVFRDNDMGSEWNHSDDLLAFVNYWTLYRYAFTEDLRRLYAAAVKDHWELEKVERCPLWNFVYAMTGAPACDAEGAMWTLQTYPLDLISWSVSNSLRYDITKLPDNFRRQQIAQLLPPDERAIMRWNGNPFIMDGGDGGATELAGDEFLLPYWMGRYLRIIQ